jgi:hypothetical protein
MRIGLFRTITILGLVLGSLDAAAQQTIGLFQYDAGTSDGYTLLAPTPSTNTYLLDNCGRALHEWPSGYTPGNSVRLLENGELFRTCRIANTTFPGGGLGGRVQLMDWNGNVMWFYQYSNANHSQHHDAIVLPNGNVLMIAWELKTRAEAIAEGRDSTLLQQRLWPDHLIEIEPTTPGAGNIVWEWHVWDHLVQDHDSNKPNFGVVADHPELVDLNYVQPGTTTYRDWMHTNGIDYNPTLDQIAISIHNFDEVWVIDHSTTTQEAASHSGGNSGKGGDLLYRFGNPAVYGRGTVNDQVFFGQHNVQWVPAGDQYAGQLMVYNNGLGRPAGAYSTIEIWQPPVDVNGNYSISTGQPFGPTAMSWTWQDNPPTDFYSQLISGVQRLPGNHTLICEGNSGRIFELDDQGTQVWEYVNPVQSAGPLNQGDIANNNAVFRAYKYPPTYPGLNGQVLTPGNPIEGNPLPLPAICTGSATSDPLNSGFSVAPNPFSDGFALQLLHEADGMLEIYDMQGTLVLRQAVHSGSNAIAASHLAAGIYYVRLQGNASAVRVAKVW